jgi:hypothetical protein
MHFTTWPLGLGEGIAIGIEDEDQSPNEAPAVSNILQVTYPGEVTKVSPAGHLAPSNHNLRPTTKKMPRPLSWLPTPRYRRNKVGRSISAPVLTSTTNVNVARAEGIHCGELAHADLVQPIWSPQVDWMPESAGIAEQSEKAVTAVEVAGEIKESRERGENQLRHSIEILRSTAYSRLKRIIRARLHSMTLARRPSIREKPHFSKLEESSISSTTRGGVGLCRQKIRDLTGHGNVRRKPFAKVNKLSAKNIGEQHHEEQPLLMPDSMSSPSDLDAHETCPNISHCFTFGDLETSFMNTVDKLDFQQTLQQTHDSLVCPKRQPILPGMWQKTTHIGHTATVNEAGIHTSRLQPCTFSVSKASLVLALTSEPLPKVNPLGCHPNVTSFAEQLVDTLEISTPPLGTSPRIEMMQEEVQDLQAAPIYSPSSGNLSQYARLTPSSARSTPSSFHTAPLPTPENLLETPHCTPTRASGRSAAAEYAAHQRKGDIPARCSNLQLFSDYQQAHINESRKNANPKVGEMKHQTTPTDSGGGAGARRESSWMQQSTQASGAERRDVVQNKAEETEELG